VSRLTFESHAGTAKSKAIRREGVWWRGLVTSPLDFALAAMLRVLVLPRVLMLQCEPPCRLTQFKTRVHKPYPVSHYGGWKTIPFKAVHTYVHSPYRGIPSPALKKSQYIQSYLVKTGKNQYHLLSPNTCSAFFIADPKLKPSLFGP